MNCSTCLTLWHESGERQRPACTVRRCEVAHLMNPGFEPWLRAFRILNCEMLGRNGVGKAVLEENDWMDIDSLQIFEQMHVYHKNAQAEVLKNQQDRMRRESEANRGRRR